MFPIAIGGVSVLISKVLLGLLWLGFLSYAFFLAPPDRPETFILIQNLSTGQWDGINPWIIALFNVMGIWPLLYFGVLFADGDGQKVRAWPFAVASMAVGAFSLLPYLALRTPHTDWSGKKTWGLRIWDSRWIGAIALLGSAACLWFGVAQGDWSDFVRQWYGSRFIHVMSLDFLMLSVLFPTLLSDDMTRRGMDPAGLLRFVAIVPLIGPCLYLMGRSPLSDHHLKEV
jgi:hypothetical protein